MTALFLALRVLLGDPFPATRLPALDGPAVDLPAPDHALVVVIFATWCASCHQALPILERLRGRFAEDVTFVTVCEDEGEDAGRRIARLAADTGLHRPILLDADHALYQRLGVKKLPTAYVVDAAGAVRHIDNGFGPGYEERLSGWIQQTRAAHSPIAPKLSPMMRARNQEASRATRSNEPPDGSYGAHTQGWCGNE